MDMVKTLIHILSMRGFKCQLFMIYKTMSVTRALNWQTSMSKATMQEMAPYLISVTVKESTKILRKDTLYIPWRNGIECFVYKVTQVTLLICLMGATMALINTLREAYGLCIDHERIDWRCKYSVTLTVFTDFVIFWQKHNFSVDCR